MPSGQTAHAPTCIFPVANRLGEGPHWLTAQRRLLWVDIQGPAIWTGDPETGETWHLPVEELIGVAVPCPDGPWIAALQSGFASVDPVTGRATPIAAPASEPPGNRFNDGKCDTRGRFWAGTLAIDDTPGRAALYRLDPDGGLHVMEPDVDLCNGLGWSPDDRRFYFTDSLRRTIYVYDFDAPSGTIENRRVFARLGDGDGLPDGLAVDAEGFVWSAHWDGWRITRYDPEGAIERVVEMPVPRPTSCAFGGADLDQLFVTSARVGLSAETLARAPLSGGVFRLEAGVRGLPEACYGLVSEVRP